MSSTCGESNGRVNDEGGLASETLRDAVFSNDVVWANLGKCLNFADLKDCRHVSRNFNGKVLKSTNFKARAVLTLKRTHLVPTNFGTTRERWKRLKILAFKCPSQDPPVDLTWFYPHLSEVESLEIGFECSSCGDGVLVPTMKSLLEGSIVLKKLCLDQEYLNEDFGNADFLAVESVQTKLKLLTDLQLKASLGRPLFRHFPQRFGEWLDAFSVALKNLVVVDTSGIIPEDLENNLDTVDEELHSKVQSLLQLVEANKSRITSLMLDDMQLWCTSATDSLHSLTTKTFPSLKAVKIRLNQNESPKVVSFLRNQPCLQEIDLVVLNTCPEDLMAVLREKSNRLKKLSIKAKGFDKVESNCWDFLGLLTNLEEFNLTLIQSFRFSANCEFPPTVISPLPKTVKKLYLKGLPSSFDFDSVISPATFSSLNPLLLTELSISRCGGCVNDDVLEFVCKTFTCLRILNISNTTSCTDYGFTGLPLKEGSAPFSLSNLQGLRSLTLRACGSISDVTLKRGIKFLELRYLDVSNNSKITGEGMLLVLEQNPSLEIFKTSEPEGEVETFPSEDELLEKHHRLKKHIFSVDGDSDDDDASEIHHRAGSDISWGGRDYYDNADFYDFDDEEENEREFFDEDNDDGDSFDGWSVNSGQIRL